MTRPVQAGAVGAAVGDDDGLVDDGLRAGQLFGLAVVPVAEDWPADRDDEPGVCIDGDLVVGGVPVASGSASARGFPCRPTVPTRVPALE
jgi:hypothetical protein